MNILSREKQIEVIAALCEGAGIRTAAQLTGVNRGTVGSLALRVGLGCMELHDRMMVGIRTFGVGGNSALFASKMLSRADRQQPHPKRRRHFQEVAIGTGPF